MSEDDGYCLNMTMVEKQKYGEILMQERRTTTYYQQYCQLSRVSVTARCTYGGRHNVYDGHKHREKRNSLTMSKNTEEGNIYIFPLMYLLGYLGKTFCYFYRCNKHFKLPTKFIIYNY